MGASSLNSPATQLHTLALPLAIVCQGFNLHSPQLPHLYNGGLKAPVPLGCCEHPKVNSIHVKDFARCLRGQRKHVINVS